MIDSSKYCQDLRISSIGNSYRIVSRIRLSEQKIHEFRMLGFLGYGQEYRIMSPCNGSEQVDPKETMKSPLGADYFDLEFFVYEVLDLVDSSG